MNHRNKSTKSIFVFDRLILSFLTFLLTLSTVALISARFGLFSASVSLLISLAFGVSSYIWWGRRLALPTVDRWLWLIVVASIMGGIFSGFYATNDMWGGRDPGLYMEITGNISLQGKSQFDRPELRKGFAENQDLLTRYPGVYDHRHHAHKGDEWELVSQFNDLTPATRAIFVRTFGFSGYAIAIGFFSFGALLFLGLVTRQLSNSCAGVLAIALLSISAPYVYASRTNLSEVPTMMFALGTVYLMSIYERNASSRFVATLLVGFFGLICFSRPDGILYGLMLAAFAFFMGRAPATNLGSILLLYTGGFLVAFLAFWDLHLNSGPYFSDLATTDRGLDKVIIFVSAVTLVAGILTILARRSPKSFVNFLENAPKWLGIMSVVTAIAFFLYKYYLAHLVDIESAAEIVGRERVFAFQKRLAKELSWYLPLPFIAAAAWTGYRISTERCSAWTSAFVIFSMFCLVLFLYRNMIYPDHMWATRRWLLYVIAPICILASVIMTRVIKTPFFVSAAIIMIVFGTYTHSNIRIAGDWMFASSQKEWKAEYDEMAEVIKASNAEYVLVQPSAAAGTLAFVYGVPALPASDDISPHHPRIFSKRVCASSIQPWQGYQFYKTRGKQGTIYHRCFNATAIIPDPIKTLFSLDISRIRDSAQKSLNTGWHAPESWGVWSASQDSKIAIPLNELNYKFDEFADKKLTLVLELRVLVGADTPMQEVEIQVEKLTSWRETFTNSRPKLVELKLPSDFVRTHEQIEITFSSQILSSPKQIGLNDDSRQLGVGLSRVAILDDLAN